MKDIINIGIAEDHPLVREGLVSTLKNRSNIQILFEVSNGNELFKQLKLTRPDILLLDIEMPEMKGPEIIEKMNVKFPHVKVVIVSAFFQRDYIVECFKLGAKAFLPKAEKTEKIIEAIIAVHKFGMYTDIEVTKILVEEINASSRSAIPDVPELSDAELEVLKLLSKGLNRNEAAGKLGVRIDTIAFHVKNMKRKTQTPTSSALVAFAIQHKLI